MGVGGVWLFVFASKFDFFLAACLAILSCFLAVNSWLRMFWISSFMLSMAHWQKPLDGSCAGHLGVIYPNGVLSGGVPSIGDTAKSNICFPRLSDMVQDVVCLLPLLMFSTAMAERR